MSINSWAFLFSSRNPIQSTVFRSFYRSNDDTVQRRQERRVTVIVCAIVCCFIITQGPSSLLLLWNMFGNGFDQVTNRTLFDISRVVNFLTAIGKSSNFFLFCFISSSFRTRLVQLIIKKKKHSTILSQIRYLSSRRRTSSATKSARSRSQDLFQPETSSAKVHALTFLRSYSAQSRRYSELNNVRDRELLTVNSSNAQLTEKYRTEDWHC